MSIPTQEKLTNRASRFYLDLLKRELTRVDALESYPHLETQLAFNLDWAEVDEDTGVQQVVVKVEQLLTDYTVRLNAHTEEVISWYIDFLSKGGDDSMSEKDAIEIAEKVATPPKDAELTSREWLEGPGGPVFKLEWTHRYKKLPIEGDRIVVLINGLVRKPFSFTRHWRSSMQRRAEER